MDDATTATLAFASIFAGLAGYWLRIRLATSRMERRLGRRHETAPAPPTGKGKNPEGPEGTRE